MFVNLLLHFKYNYYISSILQYYCDISVILYIICIIFVKHPSERKWIEMN